MNITGDVGESPATEYPGVAADDQWLQRVSSGASRDAGGLPEVFLGDYLRMLADAAITGQRPVAAELEAVRRLGRRAAESGVSPGRGIDLYLSAARRVWGELPAVVRERDNAAVRAAADAVLHVIEDAVASFAEGHADARREMIRHEETIRRQLVEDLLRGDAHLGELVERAEPFGLDLTRAHQVVLAQPERLVRSIDAATTALERVVLDRFGDRDVLVATKDGYVVVLALADGTEPSGSVGRASKTPNLGELVHTELSRLRRASPWHVAVGRPHPGAYGIARSYEEAREGLTMAARMQLDSPVIQPRDLLVYRVLFRDQPAMVDLVHSVLSPLQQARGGARPLLDTLSAYFACGGVATAAATRLHLSVRAVTYRLERVRTLTGYDPADATDRFAVHVAVLGAQLLGWPEHRLSPEAAG
jgi:sugar diacid utilization regulator